MHPSFSLCENLDGLILKAKIRGQNVCLNQETHIFMLTENVSIPECVLSSTKVHDIY